jgi:hypothetical protein
MSEVSGSLKNSLEFLEDVYQQLVFSGINDTLLFKDFQKAIAAGKEAVSSAKRVQKVFKPIDKDKDKKKK